MAGGMRLDNDDIRALPLHMQEQVAMEIVAQSAKALPVAGREEKRPCKKVTAKRLRFTGARAAERYRVLRDAARQGVISELGVLVQDGYIYAFTYRVVWGGEFIPTGIPVKTLITWRNFGAGTKVAEPIKKERYTDGKKEKIP